MFRRMFGFLLGEKKDVPEDIGPSSEYRFRVLNRLNVKFHGAIVTEQQWQLKQPRKLMLFRVAGGAIESSLDNDLVPPRKLPAKFVVVDTSGGPSSLLLRAHPDQASLENWLEQIEPTVADALRRSLVH